MEESLRGIQAKLTVLADLCVDALTQNKTFCLFLLEHILGAYQKLYIHNKEKTLQQSPSVEALVKLIHESSDLLISTFSDDPRVKRKKDKQNEYLFDRESAEIIQKIKTLLEDFRVLTTEIKLDVKPQEGESKVNLELHARTTNSNTGVIGPEETSFNPRTFSLFGDDLFCGRDTVFSTTLNRFEKSDEEAKLKLIVVHGSIGIGKTSYATRLCRALLKSFQDANIKNKTTHSFRTFNIRCRANTEYPLTTIEIMQQVIKTWFVGNIPTKLEDVKQLYHRTFSNNYVVMQLDDPVNTKQVLELLPRYEGVGFMKTAIVVTSNSTLGLDTFTEGKVDLIDSIKGVKEAKTRKQSVEDEGISGEQSPNSSQNMEHTIEDDDEVPRNPKDLQIQKEVEQIFGKQTKKQVFSITLQAEDESQSYVDEEDMDEELINEDLSKVKHPKNYHLILCHLDKLNLAAGTQIIQECLPTVTKELAGSLSVLCENIPLFAKLGAKTFQNFVQSNMEDFVQYLSDEMDTQADAMLGEGGNSTAHEIQLKSLCFGFLIGCIRKWPKGLQDTILKLTIFPSEFDALAAAPIIDKPFGEFLEHITQLVDMGVVRACSVPQRYHLHDLAREAINSYIDDAEDEGQEALLTGATLQQIEEGKERMMQYFFDQLKLYNNEHKFAGLAVIPGLERYDLDIENFKHLMKFMKETPSDYVEAVNRSRYLIADRVMPINRGILYQRLGIYAEKMEDPIQRAQFYEGLSLVYYELTDNNRAYSQGKKALEILEQSATQDVSKAAEYELEMLPVLKLMGDLTTRTKAYEHSKKYYERIMEIVVRRSQLWQKVDIKSINTTTAMGTAEASFFEQGEDVVLDPFIAHAQTHIAVVYLSSNDFQNGRRMFNKGSYVLKRLYGNLHPELSQCFAEYANVLKQYKNVRQYFDEINMLFREALNIDKKLFGEYSLLVSDRLDDWGVSLLGQGKFNEAEQHFRASLNIKHRNFGFDACDITISACLNNLAVAVKNQGRMEEAEQLYEQSLRILIELLGPEHSQVSVAKANLAHVYSSQGKSQKADLLYKEAFTTIQSASAASTTTGNGASSNAAPAQGEQSPEILAAMYNNMGDSARQQNNFSEALQYYQQALAIRRKLTQDVTSDPEIAKTLSSIARLCFDKGEFEQAEQMQQEAMNILEKTVGTSHPQYVNALNTLANAMYKQNKLEKAEQYFTESIKIRREVLKEEDYKIVGTLQSLAVTYEKQKRFKDAEMLFREVLKVLEQHPQGDDKLRSVLTSIASAMSRQKAFAEAEKYYMKAQTYVLKEFGDNSVENANILSNLAATQVHQENYDAAAQSFSKALQIYTENLGEDHEKVLQIRDNLQEIEDIIRRRDKANKKCCGACVVQ